MLRAKPCNDFLEALQYLLLCTWFHVTMGSCDDCGQERHDSKIYFFPEPEGNMTLCKKCRNSHGPDVFGKT